MVLRVIILLSDFARGAEKIILSDELSSGIRSRQKATDSHCVLGRNSNRSFLAEPTQHQPVVTSPLHSLTLGGGRVIFAAIVLVNLFVPFSIGIQHCE